MSSHPTHTVVLYARGFCEFSEMVRLHLESRGQPYTEKDIDQDEEARAAFMSFAAPGTPVTVIDGEPVIGFDEEALDALLGFEPYNAPHPPGAPLDE